MLVVAGISLRNLAPRVWDPDSPFYLPELQAIMVSYADFERMPSSRQRAMKQGLRAYLGVPDHISIYLDNGAFYQLAKGGQICQEEYEHFVSYAQPDWYPIPQDYIPTPSMSDAEQLRCLERTMLMNRAYRRDGFIPVIHISRYLREYLHYVKSDADLSQKPVIALGGIVPNLLRAPRAIPYDDILDSLQNVRAELSNRKLHVFGIGGTATIHLAALLGIDSVDSSGWRNRAARGIVQLPGRGDRVVVRLGKWHGREPDQNEWDLLNACKCPGCVRFGVAGLKENGLRGFSHRATHNLWILLNEAKQVERHLSDGSYSDWFEQHIHNSTYRPLIEYAWKHRQMIGEIWQT